MYGANKITFNSFQMKKDLLNLFPKLNPNKIKPIIWGVNYKQFNDVNIQKIIEMKKDFNLSDEKIILSFRGFKDLYNKKVYTRVYTF